MKSNDKEKRRQQKFGAKEIRNNGIKDPISKGKTVVCTSLPFNFPDQKEKGIIGISGSRECLF